MTNTERYYTYVFIPVRIIIGTCITFVNSSKERIFYDYYSSDINNVRFNLIDIFSPLFLIVVGRRVSKIGKWSHHIPLDMHYTYGFYTGSFQVDFFFYLRVKKKNCFLLNLLLYWLNLTSLIFCISSNQWFSSVIDLHSTVSHLCLPVSSSVEKMNYKWSHHFLCNALYSWTSCMTCFFPSIINFKKKIIPY